MMWVPIYKFFSGGDWVPWGSGLIGFEGKPVNKIPAKPEKPAPKAKPTVKKRGSR